MAMPAIGYVSLNGGEPGQVLVGRMVVDLRSS